MGRKAEDNLDDILGGEPTPDRKAAKSARLKALAPSNTNTTKEKVMAKAAAAPTKPARAAKDTKGNAAKPVKKKAAAAASTGEAKARRKPEWTEGESDKMLAAITKLMPKVKKINSKELAEKIGYGGQMHKVRPVLARAVSAGVLEIKAGASPAEGTTLIAK